MTGTPALIGGAELVEQVKRLVDDPARFRRLARAVDSCHHGRWGLVPNAKRLARLGTEARLWASALGGPCVDQDPSNAIGPSTRHALDFAAKSDVALGVDNVCWQLRR